TAKELADQKLLVACKKMLADANARSCRCRQMPVLKAFSLSDRIENEDDVAHAGQPLGERLVCLSGLAVFGMAARSDHAGKRKLQSLGNVKIGGDEELRLTFEDYLFDSVRISLDHSRDARIERRLFRKRGKTELDFLPHCVDVS